MAVIALASMAQDVTVKGKVVSATDKEPLIGATVRVKGSSTGTITDFDGNYSIKVDKNASLEFSMIGFNTVTETVGSRTNIDVTLSETANDLK